MSSVLVIGSGPSGVHLAASLLERGRAVTMLDVGNERPEAVAPDADFDGLKEQLDDPVDYFLGRNGQGVIYPSLSQNYFVIPPSKRHVLQRPDSFAVQTENFEPYISFAAGGLAEAWTGGSYALNDEELAAFPFGSAELDAHYETVAKRIGISAANDDLSRFSGWIEDYLDPVDTDPNTRDLLEKYGRRKRSLNSKLGFYLGRSRVAVLSRDYRERRGCELLGRCLWGCPRQAFYTPSITLAELRRHADFRYVGDAYATHFQYEGASVRSIETLRADGSKRTFQADIYALAAGTLSSSKILLDSLYRHSGQVYELPGFLDNPQILVPFINLGMIGRGVDTHAYQYHQLALGLDDPARRDYVHGQITTLKSASIHPILHSLPLDMRSAINVFRETHAALAAANVWLPDRPNPRNVLTIHPDSAADRTDLVVRCVPLERESFAGPTSVMKKALRKLGCIVPPGMTRILPKGSSVHYAGTIPMRSYPAELSCDADCRSFDFRNLYIADGASFPFLPAKNLTFTLMANASRIAERIDQRLS